MTITVRRVTHHGDGGGVCRVITKISRNVATSSCPPSVRSASHSPSSSRLFALWLYWRKGLPLEALLVLAAAVVFAILAYRSPLALRPLNRVWMKFGLLLHKIINPLVMGLLFFVVFTPTAIIMRLLRKDLLRLKKEPGVASYWIPRSVETDPPSNMKNQY